MIYLSVDDDDMSSYRIKEGDTVLVVFTVPPKSGDIALIEVSPGQLLIRQIVLHDNCYEIISSFGSELHDKSAVTIIGKVIGCYVSV